MFPDLPCHSSDSGYAISVTETAERLVNDFRSLARGEQRLVWDELAQIVTGPNYDPLTDEELTTIAGQTLALLDKEEADGETR
jgi:hypothetical protein